MSFQILKTDSQVDYKDYFVATYDLYSRKSLYDAAWDLAIGQSVGNPNVRNHWETNQLFEDHSCIIIDERSEKELKRRHGGKIRIGFPLKNIDWWDDGVSQLLCMIMGGQMDIEHITGCQLIDLDIPAPVYVKHFNEPRYGISGFRNLTEQFDKPLLGGIIKPKTGLAPPLLLDMVKEMVEGGVDFIKEDEIMANPAVCPLKDRVDLISRYISNTNVIYCYCINGDPHSVIDRAKFVAAHGGHGVHVNLWSGLGVYNSIRQEDLELFIHFQKSGDRVFTNKTNQFGIHWRVICQLAVLMGVDSIHAGMYGGYLSDSVEELHDILAILLSGNVTPALSCGMHPGLVSTITKKFGPNYMANVGGALHGHPGGTQAGVKAMRQAIDGNYGAEYYQAIDKWGRPE